MSPSCLGMHITKFHNCGIQMVKKNQFIYMILYLSTTNACYTITIHKRDAILFGFLLFLTDLKKYGRWKKKLFTYLPSSEVGKGKTNIFLKFGIGESKSYLRNLNQKNPLYRNSWLFHCLLYRILHFDMLDWYREKLQDKRLQKRVNFTYTLV